MGGGKIVLGCYGYRALLKMFNPQSGNYLNVNVYFDGRIEVSTCMAFPRSKLTIAGVSLQKNGHYDKVELRAEI